ncbi:MAG: DUF2871 domain-containing protein [Sarcina sp.]
MKKLFYAAMSYLLVGLCSGVFYREYTVLNHFTGHTQLKLAHVHILVLGFLIFFILILFEKAFTLTKSKWFKPFFIVYNIGAIWTMLGFIIIGIRQVKGIQPGPAIDGIIGLGHIVITIGFILLFLVLRERILICEKEKSLN